MISCPWAPTPIVRPTPLRRGLDEEDNKEWEIVITEEKDRGEFGERGAVIEE